MTANEKEMVKLLKVAHSIVNYVGMDPWEYECYGKDLAEFNKGVIKLGIIKETE